MPRCNHGTDLEREIAWVFDNCPLCMATEIHRLRTELEGTKAALRDVGELVKKDERRKATKSSEDA